MRNTIRGQFIVGFALIFTVMILVLNAVVGIFLRTSNDQAIEKEMAAFANHSNVYVRQAFLVNNLSNDSAAFDSLAREIVYELSAVTSADVAAYTIAGTLLQTTNEQSFLLPQEGEDRDQDLRNAIKGTLSFAVITEEEDMRALFAFPVEVAGERVGILRISKSYLDLSRQANSIKMLVFIVSLSMCLAAFGFLLLLTNNISRPILALARATNQMAKGRRVLLNRRKRKDEIAQLIDNYNGMVKRIQAQIRIIERDRDELGKLNTHRKDFYDQLTHELKTPLTTIMGYAEVLQQNRFTDEPFFDMGMDYIIGESKRLDEMVRSLLEFSKGVSHIQEQHARINLSQLCARSVDEMQLKAGRYSSECVTDIEGQCFVWGAPSALKRMLLNLIDNAIKYGERGGLIMVRVGKHKGRICLSIENKGRTLSQAEIHKLFVPFYQTDPKQITEAGSAGLGLSIVKSIVDAHHGQVAIDSRNGVTTARVWLQEHSERRSGHGA